MFRHETRAVPRYQPITPGLLARTPSGCKGRAAPRPIKKNIMKLKFNLLAGALVAGILSLQAWAQDDPTPTPLGAEKKIYPYINVQIRNLQNQSLGRIKDLGVDLVNGRIVEVLVVCDSSLDVGRKIVAVPPLALMTDEVNEVYRLDASLEVFKNAAAIDLSAWVDAGQSERVAASYRHFGQEVYFLEPGDTASTTDNRSKVALGYVERISKILDMPVGNHQQQKFGKVWSLSMDIPKGRILTVIILAPGNFKTKSIVAPTALAFSPTRKALLLDDSKMEYADEPRYVFTPAAYGQDANSKEESFTGPRTTLVAFDQGDGYRDLDRTVRINKDIRTAKINGRHVQVGTINGRVTLRGWVPANEDRVRIGEIAIGASRVELVDNQIVVGKPVTGG